MDAGDEFLAAEREAQRRQLPCLCIDLDMAPWPIRDDPQKKVEVFCGKTCDMMEYSN